MGWERKRAYVLVLFFVGTWLGYSMESLPPRLYLEVLGDTRKSLFIVDQNYMF